MLTLSGCSDKPLNSPYGKNVDNKKVFYSSFQERPKHLDPARSYSSNEYAFIAQIYEPLFQYHYLKKPYQLIPLAAKEMPELIYLDNKFEKTKDKNKVRYIKYVLKIKRGILYQNHPAFYKNGSNYRYHNLKKTELEGIDTIKDFKNESTRELTSDDYIYQIKRLADYKNHSPIAGVMQEYIFGFSEYNKKISNAKYKSNSERIELIKSNQIKGVEKIDNFTFSIILKKTIPTVCILACNAFFLSYAVGSRYVL